MVETPGNGREVVGGLKTTGKGCISMAMENVQLPGSKGDDTQMKMHTVTYIKDLSLWRKLQKYINDPLL